MSTVFFIAAAFLLGLAVPGFRRVTSKTEKVDFLAGYLIVAVLSGLAAVIAKANGL